MSWRVLSSVLVRVAGFPFAWLDALACDDAALAAHRDATARADLIAAGLVVDAAIAAERYAENAALDDPALRKQVSRQVKTTRAFARQPLERALPALAIAEVLRFSPALADVLGQLRASHEAWARARVDFEQAFDTDFGRARAALQALFRDRPALQEAVFMESSEAYDRLQQLLASAGPRNARARQRERLVAMYAQRFCAKNDSNSICGPHGVTYVGATDPDVRITLGDIERRATYFSHWAAQLLLDHAVTEAGEHARITWQLQPSARVDATSATWCVMDHDATSQFRRRYARSELTETTSALLRELRAPQTTASLHALSARLGLEPDEAFEFLEELQTAGLVLRGPLLAPGLFDPLPAVVQELARWPESPARDRAQAAAGRFAQLVAEFAPAGLARRTELAAQLAMEFQAETGSAATRGQGQHYADRALLHEDAFIASDVTLGHVQASLTTTLETLIRMLELGVELVRDNVRRWFRARFGEGCRVSVLDAHRAFDTDQPANAAPTGAGTLAAMAAVRALFATAIEGGAPVARVDGARLREALALAPLLAHPGYVSADLMLRRTSGPTEIVLGEVHGFFWLPTCLLDVLPPADRDRVVAEMRSAVATMANGTPTAECVFLHTQATDRRYRLATMDLRMMTPGEADATDLELGELDLELVGDTFCFRRGETEVIPLVAYANYPFLMYTSPIAPLFDDLRERFFPDSLLPENQRTERVLPRLMIDDVVVRRRTWRVPVTEMRAALQATTERELFLRAQELRSTLGCERHVFASLVGEPKPILVDFHDVFLLEALVNALERQSETAQLKISEMLPGPDELVAQAADGARTAELRMGFYRTADTVAATRSSQV